MTYDEDGWTPWIEHDGRGCPCVGRVVTVEFGHPVYFRNNGVGTGARGTVKVCVASGGGSWIYGDPDDMSTWSPTARGGRAVPIIRYRIRKPKGLTMLEEVARGVREPVDA